MAQAHAPNRNPFNKDLLHSSLSDGNCSFIRYYLFYFERYLGFIIFSFFRIHEAYPFLEPFKIPKLLALGTISVLAVHFCFGRIKPYWRPELKWLCWFFAHTTVAMFFSAGKPQAIAYWTDTFVKIFIMVFAIAWLTTTPKRFTLAAAGFTLAGIATSVIAISNALQGNRRWRRGPY